MWRKIAGMVLIILALVVLVSGIYSSVNAADDNTGVNRSLCPAGPGQNGAFNQQDDTLMEKVAAILGIDKTALKDAFKQAMQTMFQERQDQMFSNLIADGKLTQAQADQYKAWLASKPAGVLGIGCFGDCARATEMLDRLLADGKITQAQYDAYKAWIASKPAIDLPKPEKLSGIQPGDHNIIRREPGMGGMNIDMLNKLLAEGKITQEVYDAYRAWLAEKPSVELPRPEMPEGAPAGQPMMNP